MIISRIGLNKIVSILCIFFSSSAYAGNLINNGDFSLGNKGFYSGYSYRSFIDGESQYAIVNPGQISNSNKWGGNWRNMPATPSGSKNIMLVNGSPYSNVPIWSETINVKKNTDYEFSFVWTEANCYANIRAMISNITFKDFDFDKLGNISSWNTASVNFNSGLNDSITLTMVDLNTEVIGNDFALADFSLREKSSPVPEPSSLAIALIGILGVSAIVRSRRSCRYDIDTGAR